MISSNLVSAESIPPSDLFSKRDSILNRLPKICLGWYQNSKSFALQQQFQLHYTWIDFLARLPVHQMNLFKSIWGKEIKVNSSPSIISHCGATPICSNWYLILLLPLLTLQSSSEHKSLLGMEENSLIMFCDDWHCLELPYGPLQRSSTMITIAWSYWTVLLQELLVKFLQ